MERGPGLTNTEMRTVFDEWNGGELDSYLMQIARDILGYKDATGKAIVDAILAAPGQNGTLASGQSSRRSMKGCR